MTTTALAILLQVAATAQLTVNDGDEVTALVAPSGLTVQLPDFVRVVTPSPEYSVKPLVAPRAPSPNGGGAGAPERTDVRVFLVRWGKLAPAEQPITFVLADSRSVTVRLLPGTGRDDSFLDLRWARRSGGGAARGRGGEQFLGAERALLLAMLRDERLPSRKVLDQKIELPAYPDLDVQLVRSYETPEGLVGGIYTFTNRSRKPVVVNPTVLAVGTPNRAVLTQMDHEELRPCSDNDSPDPRGTGCRSVVRIVSRADRPDGLGTAGAERAPMPFVLQPKEKER